MKTTDLRLNHGCVLLCENWKKAKKEQGKFMVSLHKSYLATPISQVNI
jgi:hypothetical protein